MSEHFLNEIKTDETLLKAERDAFDAIMKLIALRNKQMHMTPEMEAGVMPENTSFVVISLHDAIGGTLANVAQIERDRSYLNDEYAIMRLLREKKCRFGASHVLPEMLMPVIDEAITESIEASAFVQGLSDEQLKQAMDDDSPNHGETLQ
jgi:hypothetical protein